MLKKILLGVAVAAISLPAFAGISDTGNSNANQAVNQAEAGQMQANSGAMANDQSGNQQAANNDANSVGNNGNNTANNANHGLENQAAAAGEQNSNAAGSSHVAQAGKVNLNTADAATLAREVKGLGAKKAEAIVAYRQEHGAFKSIKELHNVAGLTQRQIKMIEKSATIG